MLADVFGSEINDTKIDLDQSGKIDFDDCFIFADEFGREPSCGLSVVAPSNIPTNFINRNYNY